MIKKSRSIRSVFICLAALSCMLFAFNSAHAFSLNDLSSSAETAKSAAEGTSLLSRAKNVYSGFSDSTENLVDAQQITMSLLDLGQSSGITSKVDAASSESGITKLFKMVALSESMDSATTDSSLTSKLTDIITDPDSFTKAKQVYDHASTAYTSGNSSVSEAKTLYTEIKEFIASPSSKGLSEGLLSGLGEYSDQILPFIIEHGPERVKTAAQIAEVFKGFL